MGMTISGLQVWILTAVLGLSMSMLGFFSYNMYNTFDELQKSVRIIANDISIIKYTQTFYSNQQIKTEERILNIAKELNDVEKRVTKLEYHK